MTRKTDPAKTPPGPTKSGRLVRARAAHPGELNGDPDVEFGDAGPQPTGGPRFVPVVPTTDADRDAAPASQVGTNRFKRARALTDEERADLAARNPRDNVFRSARYAEAPGIEEAAIVWSRRPTFGPFVRRIREEKAMSLRNASAELGVSFNYLAKLETGGRIKAPTPRLIQAIADLFGHDVNEVLREAGFQAKTPPGVRHQERVDQEFRRLLTHPELRPLRVDIAALDYYSPLQKLQVLELAARLERAMLGEGRSLGDLLGPNFADGFAMGELRDRFAREEPADDPDDDPSDPDEVTP